MATFEIITDLTILLTCDSCGDTLEFTYELDTNPTYDNIQNDFDESHECEGDTDYSMCKDCQITYLTKDLEKHNGYCHDCISGGDDGFRND